MTDLEKLKAEMDAAWAAYDATAYDARAAYDAARDAYDAAEARYYAALEAQPKEKNDD